MCCVVLFCVALSRLLLFGLALRLVYVLDLNLVLHVLSFLVLVLVLVLSFGPVLSLVLRCLVF